LLWKLGDHQSLCFSQQHIFSSLATMVKVSQFITFLIF